MAKTKKEANAEPFEIATIKQESATVLVRGKTPLIFNSMSNKVMRELLYPKGKRNTAAARAESLKHEPLVEYQNSVYRYRDEDGESPTRLYFPVGAFKRAIAKAALDVPGITKAQVERLCWIEGEKVPIYGVPELFMTVVRSADMAKTPDVRTRAILRQWACKFTVRSVAPLIKTQDVIKLLAIAGVICGIGDGRQEKGAFSFGQFELADVDDAQVKAIVKGGGRRTQDEALAEPGFYDHETEALFTWFYEEVKRRSASERLAKKTTKTADEDRQAA